MLEFGHLLNNSGGKCKIINIGGGFPVSYLNKQCWENFLNRIEDGYINAQNGDISKIHVWNNNTGGFLKNKNGNIDFNNWKGIKFYSPYAKSKMLEAILTSDIIINGRQINTVKALKELGTPALLIEPGRSIVADTGITLAKVAHVRKIVNNHNLLTLEMGIVNNGEALIHSNIRFWEILTDYHRKDKQPFEAFVAGNLCFSGDIISKYKITLQRKPKRGDIVAVYDTGAYDSHIITANTNAFPRPARLMIDNNGKVIVLKKRDAYKEIFSQ
jgi:diaminopimelate decarboxylase